MECIKSLRRLVAASLVAVLALTPTGCGAVLIRSLRVPPWAELGHSAVLQCLYDTQGEPLYSVKWYKDKLEFYRYHNGDHSEPKIQMFQTRGIHVERSKSNDTTVQLSRVDLDTAGEYTCEVSVDAPTFLTAVSSAHLKIVSMPSKGPDITGLARSYVPGETLVANCTIGPAYPQARLRWFINGDEVDEGSLLKPLLAPATVVSTSPRANWRTLRLPVEASIFKGRRAELRCSSSVAELAHRDAFVTAVLSDRRPSLLAQYDAAASTRHHVPGLLVSAAAASALLLPTLSTRPWGL